MNSICPYLWIQLTDTFIKPVMSKNLDSYIHLSDNSMPTWTYANWWWALSGMADLGVGLPQNHSLSASSSSHRCFPWQKNLLAICLPSPNPLQAFLPCHRPVTQSRLMGCVGEIARHSQKGFPPAGAPRGYTPLSNSVDLYHSHADTAAILPPWGAKPKDQAYELRLEKVWVFEDIVKATLNLSTFRLQVAQGYLKWLT